MEHFATDDVDRRLVEALVANPGAAVAQLAEQSRTSPASASRRLSRLQRLGAVRVVGRTAPGFGSTVVRMVRARGEIAAVRAAAERAAPLPTVTWGRVSRDHTELVLGSIVSPTTTDHVLDGPLRGLDARAVELLRVWAPGDAVLVAPRTLDALDVALLDALAVDGRQSGAQLASRLGIDASTATRRRARLLHEGVLYLEAVVDPALVTSRPDHMAWLGVAPGHVCALGDRLWAMPEVVFVAATSGPTQLVATVRPSPERDVLTWLDEELADAGVTSVDLVPLAAARVVPIQRGRSWA